MTTQGLTGLYEKVAGFWIRHGRYPEVMCVTRGSAIAMASALFLNSHSLTVPYRSVAEAFHEICAGSMTFMGVKVKLAAPCSHLASCERTNPSPALRCAPTAW